jgi:4-hydroxy-2-oxoheptanedioate aldolase
VRPSVVKAKLRAGKPVVGVSLHIPDPSLYELTSLYGFDFIWTDLEHHGTHLESVSQMIRATRVGNRTDVMVRPGKGEFMRMGRMLELGAHGIMYPRCDNADEAREVVRWSKFGPLGCRGFDGSGADNPYCDTPFADYIRQANEETWVVIQIEDPKALEHVDEIASVEGVDVVMLGPADFSILAGVPGQLTHPKVLEAIAKVKAAADRHGKAWGTPGLNPQRMRELLDQGARWMALGADLIWVKQGLERTARELTELGLEGHSQTPVKAGSYLTGGK